MTEGKDPIVTDTATTPLLIDNSKRLAGRTHGFTTTANIVDGFRISQIGEGGLVTTDDEGGWIDWAREEGDDVFQKLCRKCGGDGQHWANHIADGECFRCWGSGLEPRVGHKTLRELEQKLQATKKAWERKEAKRLAECAARDERVARFTAAEPTIWALLEKTQTQIAENYAGFNGDDYHKINPFLRNMLERLTNVVGGGEFSEKQVEALRKFVMPKPADENSAPVPVFDGRTTILGEIVSIKGVESDFGYAVKITVRDDRGFKVYGTMPTNLRESIYDVWYAEKGPGSQETGYGSLGSDYGNEVWFEQAKGLRIQFDATVEKSDRDEAFGFFKRPTKGVIPA